MTSDDQIARWLSEPEGERLEFKSARNHFHFEKLVDYCVALANEGGGIILLGATDERPRQVVGTNAFSEPGRTEAGLYQHLHHRVPVEEKLYHGNRLLIVHVPSRLPGTAWQCRFLLIGQGRAYSRQSCCLDRLLSLWRFSRPPQTYLGCPPGCHNESLYRTRLYVSLVQALPQAVLVC